MILEEASLLTEDERNSMMRDLRDLEVEGASRATPVRGVGRVLEWVRARGIPWAVVSRNCRESIERAADVIGLELPQVVRSRDDGETVKPDPRALLDTCAALGADPCGASFIGDFIYDMMGARRAGVRGVLVSSEVEEEWGEWLECSFSSMDELMDELERPSEIVPWEYIDLVRSSGRGALERNFALSIEMPIDAYPGPAAWAIEAARLGVGEIAVPDVHITPALYRRSFAFDPSAIGMSLERAVSELLRPRFPLVRVRVGSGVPAPSDASELPLFLEV